MSSTKTMSFLDRITEAAASYRAWARAMEAPPLAEADDAHEQCCDVLRGPFTRFLAEMPRWPAILSVAEAHALLRLSADCFGLLSDGIPADNSGFEGMRDRAILALGRLTERDPGLDPDASLIARCKEIAELQRDVSARYARCYAEREDERVADAEVKPLDDRTVELLEQVASHRALTVAGLQHKALAMAAWNRELLKDCNDWDAVLVQSLVGDLLGINTDDDDQLAAAREQIKAATLVPREFSAEIES